MWSDRRGPELPGSEEIQLIERLRAGDAAALEALMSKYAARVYRLAFGITRNQGDAGEVVQDVFLTIAMKGGTFEGRSAFGSWIYRITTNAALNKRRGKRFKAEASLKQLPRLGEERSRAEGWERASAARSPTPDEGLLRTETRTVLNRALAALPDHYRAVVILRYVEELPSADVAGVLQESESCVKSKLHRARLVLRERLAYYFPDRQRRSSTATGGAEQPALSREPRS